MFVAGQLLVKRRPHCRKANVACGAVSAAQLPKIAVELLFFTCGIQQDTKEYLIRGVPKSEFFGNQKRGDEGGGEEGRSGGRVNRA